MSRSEITIDLGALHRNVALLVETAAPAEVWAVVKADAYGHGASDCARAALRAGASALCVATVGEGAALRESAPDARILVLSPLAPDEEQLARQARLEVAIASPRIPDGLPVHVKVDTGMGRFGMSRDEAASLDPERVVGLMSHLATADEADSSFARAQVEAFGAIAARFPHAVKHLANSAATLSLPESRFDAVRCGVALYGLSPFGDDPSEQGLDPVLAWRSHVAQAKLLRPGESTGYGRRFVAERKTRVGLVPVGYGDGFRRGLTGTEVLVDGVRRRVVGNVSMDSFAVELGDEGEGAPVTLIGDGLRAEEHARRLGTINYEVTTGIVSDPRRASRKVVDG
ncbi:MAG TPA: alanine racemase [Gaiellaceae bacterium]|jgi:alanine racemase